MFSNFVRLKKIYGAIDELYMSYLTSENPLLDFIFYKKNWYLLNKKNITREQAHQDLKKVYGRDDDTDKETYDSDLEYNI